MQLVDGGYLSWSFGVDGGKINAWNLSKHSYSAAANTLFLMDSPQSLRKEFFSDYKSLRHSRREENPERIARKERVDGFKSILRSDPSLAMIEVDGLEADDLVGVCAYLTKNPLTVIGVDKDLLQLGWRIRMEKIDGTEVTLENFKRSIQKTIAPFIATPENLLYDLVLMGDKSDSIPRLVPPRELDLFIECITHRDPWMKAVNEFGWHDVARNLYLAVLPGPWCFSIQGDYPTPEDVFHSVRRRRWPEDVWKYLDDEILTILRLEMSNRLANITGGSHGQTEETEAGLEGTAGSEERLW